MIWRNNAGTHKLLSAILTQVACLVSIVSLTEWLFLTCLFPAALLSSTKSSFLSVHSFHTYCLNSFWKYFLSPNLSKTFRYFQLNPEHRCHYYRCCYWYYCYHYLLLLVLYKCYICFFDRSLNVLSHDLYETFLRRGGSLHLQCSNCWYIDTNILSLPSMAWGDL